MLPRDGPLWAILPGRVPNEPTLKASGFAI
jgi:hypothetical protein